MEGIQKVNTKVLRSVETDGKNVVKKKTTKKTQKNCTNELKTGKIPIRLVYCN